MKRGESKLSHTCMMHQNNKHYKSFQHSLRRANKNIAKVTLFDLRRLRKQTSLMLVRLGEYQPLEYRYLHRTVYLTTCHNDRDNSHNQLIITRADRYSINYRCCKGALINVCIRVRFLIHVSCPPI